MWEREGRVQVETSERESRVCVRESSVGDRVRVQVETSESGSRVRERE